MASQDLPDLGDAIRFIVSPSRRIPLIIGLRSPVLSMIIASTLRYAGLIRVLSAAVASPRVTRSSASRMRLRMSPWDHGLAKGRNLPYAQTHNIASLSLRSRSTHRQAAAKRRCEPSFLSATFICSMDARHWPTRSSRWTDISVACGCTWDSGMVAACRGVLGPETTAQSVKLLLAVDDVGGAAGENVASHREISAGGINFEFSRPASGIDVLDRRARVLGLLANEEDFQALAAGADLHVRGKLSQDILGPRSEGAVASKQSSRSMPV